MKAMLVYSSDDGDRRVLLAERDGARREHIVVKLCVDFAKMKGKLLKSEMGAAKSLHQIFRLESQLVLLFDTSSWRRILPMRQLTSIVDWICVSLGGPPLPVLPGPVQAKPVEAVPFEPPNFREQAILNCLQQAD